MKKFLIIFASLLVIGYLIFAMIYFRDTSAEQVCHSFEVIVKDSSDTHFLLPDEIRQLLKNKGLNPIGKQMKDINTLDIRQAILTNQMVKSAEVYSGQNSSIIAVVTQRSPVLRVMSDVGGNYYIDRDREKMPTSIHYSAYVPVATGAVSEEFAKNQLFDFAEYLQNHPEWDAWIEQIVVTDDDRVELIPRAGDFRIVLGTLDDYEKKLEKFSVFVEKGLNVVGWNRYSVINLSYDKQVVCTKK
jgi:cell division protein FtsQ